MARISRFRISATGLGTASTTVAALIVAATALAPACIDGANAAEVTLDISDYSYEETQEGRFFMADDSDPPFVSLGIRDWDRPATDGSFGFMYTGEGTAGRVAYDSQKSPPIHKTYYKARFEGYLAYRINQYFTPYIGLGYRFLHDDSGGKIGSDGGIFYDRQNHLAYLPVGVRVDPFENWSFKLQANYLIKGWQISYTTDGRPAGYSDAHNKQDKGWGVDFTANYQLNDKWSAYGFFRYWNIDRSDSDCGDVPTFGYVCWWEPTNTTQEIGLGVAYRF